MSGEAEVVELLPGASGGITRLVETAGAVAAAGGQHVALIGGLAVACRLGTVHRATQDVDAVAEASPGTQRLIEVLVADADAEPTDRAHRVVVDGVKVEVIETEALPDSLDGIPADQRLFVLAHRWALMTATPMTVVVAGTDVTASLPVASEASLVAMKLHAAIDRTDDPKRASDVYDIYRLLVRRGAHTRSFELAPHDLTELVEINIAKLFDDHAERTARWMLVHGGADAQRIGAEDLRRVGSTFVSSLQDLRREGGS